MIPLKNEEIEKLENFVGYGKVNADIIFIGLEEAGGGYDNFRVRLGIPNYQFLDCKRFHLDKLKCIEYHSDDSCQNIKKKNVWAFMSYLMLRLDGVDKNSIFEKDSLILKQYQSNLLGTLNENGKTLLTEIYPIPCPKFNQWQYTIKKDKKVIIDENYIDIIKKYKNKNEYKKEVLPKRIKIMNEVFSSDNFSAKAIICYGVAGWKEFESFFKNFKVELKKSTIKSCKMGLLNNKTKVFLTPFFGIGHMSYEKMEMIANEIKC